VVLKGRIFNKGFPVRAVTIVLSFLVLLPSSVFACEYPRGPVFNLLAEWTKTCGHPLCGKIHIAEPSRLKESAKACDAPGWMSMREDIRATLVAGGAVMFGEVHDNPLHHDLRSRMGMSNFASVVMEQMTTDKSAILDTFWRETSKNYKDGDLDKLKTATDWQNGGWSKYNYDPLFLAILKGAQPIFAGDAPLETVKAVAKSGESAVSAEDKTRLALDKPLGEKLDAASLSEIETAHCNAMPKEALGGMAFAQRYRDATLADGVITAISKRGSTLLLAGNNHVRKDRGAAWYLGQRKPGLKTLSIMLVEVEEGKTEAGAYSPVDTDGKPAADYVIFTPRAARTDPCEAMKAKKPE
jgi:uncharacterized iron-regulated protein